MINSLTHANRAATASIPALKWSLSTPARQLRQHTTRASMAAAPISKEALQQHLQAAGDSKAKRAYFFHAHPCFALEPDSIDIAMKFREQIKEAWKGDDCVEVHTFIAKKYSLFQSCGNFEVLFTRDAYTDVITWLEFNRPEKISVLIHPLTDTVVADHSARALWMGEPFELELSGLEKAQAEWSQQPGGMHEVDIVMKVHRVQALPEDILRD